MCVYVCEYIYIRGTCVTKESQHNATQCNTLQHVTTHCNTPPHTATRKIPEVCMSLKSEVRVWMQHTATLCNTLQHATHPKPTHCNTLQHTATHCNTQDTRSARVEKEIRDLNWMALMDFTVSFQPIFSIRQKHPDRIHIYDRTVVDSRHYNYHDSNRCVKSFWIASTLYSPYGKNS